MIVASLVLIALAIVILAFVLEPIIRARMDHVQIDTAVTPAEVPDFRELLAEDDVDAEEAPAASELRAPVSNPEPAEHRS